MRATRRRDAGQVGGIEVLPFGLLVFVAGALVLSAAWAVVDARTAADAAARDAIRYIVETATTDTSSSVVIDAARAVARRSLEERGHDGPVEVDVVASARLERCVQVRVDVTIEVPSIRVPFLGDTGPAIPVTAHHSELVDPLRSGVGGEATCIG